jgi:hypothetical protein
MTTMSEGWGGEINEPQKPIPPVVRNPHFGSTLEEWLEADGQMTKQWEYSDALVETIISRMIEGESVRSICNDPNMPSRFTVLTWQATNDEFQAKCARARAMQADVIHDDLADMEVGVLSGTIPPDVARVAASMKQWRASKLAPKKYGDKLDLNQTGEMTINIGKEYDGA